MEAVQMYADHQKWRCAKGRPESLAKAFASMPAKVFTGVSGHGPARDGTGVIYFEPARYDCKAQDEETYALALCHLLDDALAPDVDGQLTVVVDVRADSESPNPKPMELMSFGRMAINILSVNYPERLRRVVVYPVPWVATMFVSMVKRMMDAPTREKLVVISGDDKALDCPGDELRQYLSLDSLPRFCWSRNRALDPMRAAFALDGGECETAEFEEDEAFYSASEGEELLFLTKPKSVAALHPTKARSGAPAAINMNVCSLRQGTSSVNGDLETATPQRDSDLTRSKFNSDDDLEAGPIFMGKEDREFLLDILKEARNRQPGRWCWWLPCRCKWCGHRSRYRL